MNWKDFTFIYGSVTITIKDCGLPEALARIQAVTPEWRDYTWEGENVGEFVDKAREMFGIRTA